MEIQEGERVAGPMSCRIRGEVSSPLLPLTILRPAKLGGSEAEGRERKGRLTDLLLH